MNFTSKTQRSRKIHSQHLQPLISDSPCGILEARIFLAFYFYRENQIARLWCSLGAEALHIGASPTARTNIEGLLKLKLIKEHKNPFLF